MIITFKKCYCCYEENKLTKEEILIFLKHRTLANIIDMFIIFFGFIFVVNTNSLLGIFYLILHSIVFYFTGYTFGGYILGVKVIFRKRDILTFIMRIIHSFIYNNFLLNIVGEFVVNSCGQYYYDKKCNTYFVYKNIFLSDCNIEYSISKLWHFKYYFLYTVAIFFCLFLIEMIF